MRTHHAFAAGIAIAILISVAPAVAADYSASLIAGYNGGPGATASAAVANFADGFPMGLALGIGYTSVAPGQALDARRVFINDATNGTPTKDGWRWDMRLDLTYQMALGSFEEFFLSGGPRYTFHTSNFNFIGGNENFDVTSKAWGLGLGAGGAFPMGSKAAFVLSGGADYYFEGTIEGHDTAYSPDGENLNGRNDYTYADAQDAINEPALVFRLMIGVSYYFGR
jgi:hypothetical protein